MDSGNSGSIQSSSGGDEEYDSRGEPISPFLSPHSGLTFPSQSHPRHHPPPPSDDPISSYLDAFARRSPQATNSNTILNIDMLWPRGLRSSDEPNCTDFGVLGGSAAAAPPPPYNPTASTVLLHTSPWPPCSSSSQQPSAAPPEQPPNGAAAGTAAPPRASKKRPRASRRAPTTVLTTDTSNFRAMVQEFTGIPSSPFASTSGFSRPRFDLFRAAAGPPDPLPDTMTGYLLRPFAQKAPLPAFGPFASGASLASSSSAAPSNIGVTGSTRNVTTTTTASASPTAAPSSTNANTSITRALAAPASITSVSTSTTTSNIPQLPSDLRLGSQHQDFMNVLSFQSLFQRSPPPNHNSPTASNHGMEKAPQVSPPPPMVSASQAAPTGYAIGAGGRGRSNAHLGTLLPGLAVPEATSSWRGGGGGGGGRGDVVLRWIHGSAGMDGRDRGQFRPTGGDPQRGNSCTLNCTGSASADYHSEKGSESVPSRGEGVVDSWICSSD